MVMTARGARPWRVATVPGLGLPVASVSEPASRSRHPGTEGGDRCVFAGTGSSRPLRPAWATRDGHGEGPDCTLGRGGQANHGWLGRWWFRMVQCHPRGSGQRPSIRSGWQHPAVQCRHLADGICTAAPGRAAGGGGRERFRRSGSRSRCPSRSPVPAWPAAGRGRRP